MRDEVARPGALQRLALAVLLFEDRLREIGEELAGGDIDHRELDDALRVLVRPERDLVLVPHVVDLDDAAALETDTRALDVGQTVHRRSHRALARRLEREGVGLEAVEVAEGPPLRRHAVSRIRARPLRLGVESAVLAGEDLPPVAEAGDHLAGGQPAHQLAVCRSRGALVLHAQLMPVGLELGILGQSARRDPADEPTVDEAHERAVELVRQPVERLEGQALRLLAEGGRNLGGSRLAVLRPEEMRNGHRPELQLLGFLRAQHRMDVVQVVLLECDEFVHLL